MVIHLATNLLIESETLPLRYTNIIDSPVSEMCNGFCFCAIWR